MVLAASNRASSLFGRRISWFESRGEGRANGPIIENAKESLYFHGLVGVVKGAGGPRIIENTTIS